MHGNPMNIPPISIAAAKAALMEQFSQPVLRQRATMLWGTRGVGKSSIVRQVAAHHGVPLVDLRLTTIEPVDIRGAIYADDVQGKTVWFPPEFLPGPEQPAGILFLDELTAADQRLQISAYSLILDRKVGHYQLPAGWLVVAAGNASFHGAVSHDMGTALADRLFHFNVQSTIEAFLAYAVQQQLAPEVMAYLKVRPDKLDDTAAQLAADHLVGSSPRGWEDVSNVLKAELERQTHGATSCRAASARPTRPSFLACCVNCRPAPTCCRCWPPRPVTPRWRCCPPRWTASTACSTACWPPAPRQRTLARALDIIEALPQHRAGAAAGLPLREAQTLAMELLFQKALETGLEATVMDSAAYRRYSERRAAEGGGG